MGHNNVPDEVRTAQSGAESNDGRLATDDDRAGLPGLHRVTDDESVRPGGSPFGDWWESLPLAERLERFNRASDMLVNSAKRFDYLVARERGVVVKYEGEFGPYLSAQRDIIGHRQREHPPSVTRDC